MLRSVATSLIAAFVLTASAAGNPRARPMLRYSVEPHRLSSNSTLGVTEDWQSEARAMSNPAAGGAENDESGPDASPPATAGTINVSAMSPALFKLTGIESGLQRSHNYEVLGHIGWTQLAVPRGSGLAADVSATRTWGSKPSGKGPRSNAAGICT